ncbi:hypothetical protein V6N12_040900 [Hibiscus sabdariffa]|uniref:Amino acid transporter transmembrane domain-containing protein n=1 Tax=Hibiscus sabdariffa TaxID=183260 RepID=A0ABR2E5I2_9ROSI
MGDDAARRNHLQLPHNQVFDHSIDVLPQGDSKCHDDDGCLKQSGTVWTASAHIITAVIGSGVLSLACATAQLGWIAGPVLMFAFSFVTYYTSTLLVACYPSGDPVNGKRNYTYMNAVRKNLRGFKAMIYGAQYLNLLGVVIGYTIASSISMMVIKRSNCFHAGGTIPDFDQIWWLSIVVAVMSFIYLTIGFGLVIAKVVGIKSSLYTAQKIWRSFQALGDMAFAYSYSLVLIEIQNTHRAPPAKSKTMKKAILISVGVTTLFYMLCGCMGYAAFGDLFPRNLLTDFGFCNPFWLHDIANAAIVIHLVGAYQVYCQPLFAFVEKITAERFPESEFITKDIKIQIPGFRPYNLNLFRLVWRTAFVVVTTLISMLRPLSDDIVGLLGALGFWPLTIYFPIEMYISRKKIPNWSTRWICLQILNIAFLIISIAAAIGSIAEVITDLKSFKPFSTAY